MNIISDLTLTSLETITAFELVTGNYLWTLDELQDATIAQTEDTVDITGKGGRKLSTLKRNKAVTISGTNGLLSTGLMAIQTGGKFENKTTQTMWTDYLVVTDNSAETLYTAVGTTGSEIVSVFLKNADGTQGERLVQDATASAGKFTYDPATKKLAFDGVADNTEIVVHYKRNISAMVLENLSDTYSGKCTLYVDALAENKCGEVYRVQFYFPKVDFNGEFSIELGGDQVVHAFEASALSGACGTAGQFFTFTVFGANAEDVEVEDGGEAEGGEDVNGESA